MGVHVLTFHEFMRVKEDPREQAALRLTSDVIAAADVGPNDHTTTAEWVERFRAIGFFRVTHGAFVAGGVDTYVELLEFGRGKPLNALRLFRTADPGSERRISWTADLKVAQYFAPGGEKQMHQRAHLWSADVPPKALLAILGTEYIVDPTDLVIFDHGPVRQAPAGHKRPLATSALRLRTYGDRLEEIHRG